MNIVEGMKWPPSSFMRYKMQEHSVWYAGDPDLLAEFYERFRATNPAGLSYIVTGERFWARQTRNNGVIVSHVPIASDIAATSSDLLFSESPTIEIAEAKVKDAPKAAKDAQDSLSNMLLMSNFYSKLIEAAESCAAIGGVYIKIAWDQEINDYPIPVIEQCESAYPEFKFGILTKVDFVSVVKRDGKRVVYRLIETYSNDGSIEYNLYKGTPKNMGKIIPLETLRETEDLEDVETEADGILCVYVPNIKPNRYNRNSYHSSISYRLRHSRSQVGWPPSSWSLPRRSLAR